MTLFPDPPAPDAAVGRALRRRLVRIAAGIGGSLVAVAFVYYLGTRGFYDLHFALSILPSLFYRGFLTTLAAVAVVISLGLAIGFGLGWARTTSSLWLRGLGAVYVDFFRSMPPIVLIAFAYLIGFGILENLLGNPYAAETGALWLGAVALGLHTGAYQTEIVRAGILSVPAGQTEAADALGLTRAQTMFRVVLPQAFRVALPPLGNEFSSVIKDTSLLSVIGWFELSGIALVQVYSAITVNTFDPIVIWVVAGLFYFLVTFAVNTGVRSVEEFFRVPGLGEANA